MFSKRKARAALLFTHRWFGIIAGFYFMLMGLTGSYIVYSATFENWLNPAIRVAEHPAEHYDIARAVRSAQLGLGTTVLPTRFIAPVDPTDNLNMNFILLKAGEGRRETRQAFVAASDSSYRGAQDPRETVRGYLFRFHHEIFLPGPIGKPIVAVCGVLLLVLLFSGLYLWRPKRRFLWRSLKIPAFRTLYQSLYDLHKLWGIYSFALMLMIVFSGIYIAQPNWFEREKDEGGKSEPLVPPASSVDFAQLQSLIEAQGVAQRPLRLNINADKANIQVRAKSLSGEDRIFNYQIATRMLVAEEPDEQPFQLRALLHDLHEGKYWQSLGKALAFTGGLSTVFFFFTGVWIWWFRPSRRRRKRA